MEQKGAPDRLLEAVSVRGIMRSRELDAEGYHRATVSRLVREGRLVRLSRGVYALPGHPVTEWHDLAVLCGRVPDARVALVSALAFHGIGTQTPYETWIALPVGARRPRADSPLRIVRLSEPYYSAGVERHRVGGVEVAVYGAAKTVADCFRMRSKVGYDVAVEALREGWRARKFTLAELGEYARLNRVERVMRPYIEAIVE